MMLQFLRRFCCKFKRVEKEPVYIPVLQSSLLEGRRALITGGTGGIGFAIAKAFIDSGANVVVTGRSQERIDAALAMLANSPKAQGCVMDMCQPAGFEVALEKVGAFDILVNNAGVVGSPHFGDVTEEVYDLVLDTNLRGPALLSQEVANSWIASATKGNILNICSASSLRPGYSPYILSKWGLRALTLGLAKKLIKHGIVVNGLAPGPTSTDHFLSHTDGGIGWPRNPSGRLVTLQEIANMAVVLVSSLSRMVVGDVLYMTGGGALTTLDD